MTNRQLSDVPVDPCKGIQGWHSPAYASLRKTIAGRLKALLDRKSDGEASIRVLDVGCGSDARGLRAVLANLPRSPIRHVELWALDKQETYLHDPSTSTLGKLERSLKTKLPAGELRRVHCNINDLVQYECDREDSERAAQDEPSSERKPPWEPGTFDLIIVNATLHELHEGRRIKYELPRTLRTFLKWLSEGGQLILGDYYFAPYLTPKEIDLAIEAQAREINHADPVQFFIQPQTMLYWARQQHEASYASGRGWRFAIDDYVEFAAIDKSTEAGQEYFAGKRYFNAVLTKTTDGGPAPLRELDQEAASFLLNEGIDNIADSTPCHTKLGAAIDNAKDSEQLRELLLRSLTHIDDRGGHGLYNHLVYASAELTRGWHARKGVLGPTDLSVWVAYSGLTFKPTRLNPEVKDAVGKGERFGAYHLTPYLRKSELRGKKERSHFRPGIHTQDVVWFNQLLTPVDENEALCGLSIHELMIDTTKRRAGRDTIPATAAAPASQSKASSASLRSFSILLVPPRDWMPHFPGTPEGEHAAERHQKSLRFNADNRDLKAHPVVKIDLSRDGSLDADEAIWRIYDELWEKQPDKEIDSLRDLWKLSEGQSVDAESHSPAKLVADVFIYALFVYLTLGTGGPSINERELDRLCQGLDEKLQAVGGHGLCSQYHGPLREALAEGQMWLERIRQQPDSVGVQRVQSSGIAAALPEFRAFMTVPLTVPGTAEAIGTWMAFSDRLFEGELLDGLCSTMRPMLDPVRHLETTKKIRDEAELAVRQGEATAKAEAEARLLPQWAHSARVPILVAENLLQLLRQSSDPATHAELESQLFQVLQESKNRVMALTDIRDYSSNKNWVEDLWQTAQDGRSCQEYGWVRLERIISKALVSALLYSCYAQTTIYEQARTNLFGDPRAPKAITARIMEVGRSLEADPGGSGWLSDLGMAMEGTRLRFHWFRSFESFSAIAQESWLPTTLSVVSPGSPEKRYVALAALIGMAIEECILNTIKHGKVDRDGTLPIWLGLDSHVRAFPWSMLTITNLGGIGEAKIEDIRILGLPLVHSLINAVNGRFYCSIRGADLQDRLFPPSGSATSAEPDVIEHVREITGGQAVFCQAMQFRVLF